MPVCDGFRLEMTFKDSSGLRLENSVDRERRQEKNGSRRGPTIADYVEVIEAVHERLSKAIVTG